MGTDLSGEILLKTLWAQDSDGDLVFNTYCPIDPQTEERCVVGCAALMHAQILYYWIGLGAQFSLYLTSEDAYTTTSRHIYISGEEDPTYDYGVFSDINEQLAVISADTTDDVAALCYACGVLIESNYTSTSTSAALTDDVYVRAGFDSFNIVTNSSNTLFYTSTGSQFLPTVTITDAGFEVIQDNLLNGLVIAVASRTLSHALVMDGYNQEDGTYHLNFGWGTDSEKNYIYTTECYTGTGWYTADELNALNIYSLGIDLYPDYDGSILTVTDTREYGVGTLYRILEQAAGIQEKVTINVSADLAESSISLSTALPSVSHDLTIENLYGDIRIQPTGSKTSGSGGTIKTALSSDTTLKIENFAANFAAINSSSSAIAIKGGTKLVIDNLNGIVAANTVSTSYALYSNDAVEITMDNGGLFAGKYTVTSASGESAITNIFTAFDNFAAEGTAAFSAMESCATGYAVYSGDGDDTLSLADNSAILGAVYLAGGENTITVESGSYLHGYITASADTLALNFDLKEYSSTPLLSLTDLTVNDYRNSTVYYGIDALVSALAGAISVDASQAETGIYTLLSGTTEDGCADLVFDLGNDIQLSLAGTTESGAYALAFADDSLTLSVSTPDTTSAITITANSTSKMYDGTPLTDAGFTFTQGILATGDELIVTVEGSITDAGTTTNKIKGYTVMRSGENVTSSYNFTDTVDGTLTVTKRDVVLTSASDSKTYDGTALTNSEITVSGSGFAEGEGYTANVTGTQTEVGSSANTFTYTLDENTDADNYDISTEEGVLLVSAVKPTPPGGEEEGGGGEGGGGSTESPTLNGVLQVDSGTETYDGGEEGASLSSTTSDQNVVLVQNSATTLTLSNYTLNKTGDTTSEDNSNFYAVNAVVAATNAAKIYIDNTDLISDAEGANGLFATGEGSTIYAYNCTITSEENSSRGLDATYEGTVIAAKLTIDTAGEHCAALATDRGNGNISVTDSTLTTAGQGSPVIYSTGVIEVDNVTGTASGAQIAGIEGASTIRIKDSSLSGSAEKASEPVANGVIIYQSNSGDSEEGTAVFEVVDSTLSSAISDGAMFYSTNTSAVITVQNTNLDFDTDSNYLLKAAGNDGKNGWGTAGANGADVVFTAIDQDLAGDVSVDGCSSLDMYLINTTYTGAIELDTTYSGNGGTDLFIDADSTWTVTENSTLQTLTVESGAKIVDSSGKTVTIANSSGTTFVTGTSTSGITITVSTYTPSGTVEATHTITDFVIDRTDFETMYPDEDPETDYDDRIEITGTSAEPKSYTLQKGKTYTAAEYEGNGGAVYVGSYGTVTGENVTFKENSVTSDDSSKGGAVYNDSNATLTLTNGTFTENSATGTKGQGGAIYNSGTTTTSGTTFSSNSATMGGAIFNKGGTLAITGGTFSDNSGKYGGAIQTFSGGTVNITGTTFSENTAAAEGGAIAHNSGSMTITDATFSGNSARSSGGAICNKSTLVLANVTFSGNSISSGSSTKTGGAIYNTGTVNMTGTVTLATEDDDLYNAYTEEATGTLNWDLTSGTSSYGSIAGYQYLNNASGTLTITVDDNQEIGSYTIATGNLSNLEGKNSFTLTGIEGQDDVSLTINGESVTYNDRKYTLATNNNGTTGNLTDDNLVLTVEQLPSTAITITALSETKTYDGSALTAGYTYTQGVLAEGDELSVTVSGSITDAGSTVNKVTSYKVMRGTTDVTENYTFTDTVDGTLTVNKRNVTLTSATDSKTYDGTPLTNNTITVSGEGFASGEGYTANVTGSQTAVGSSANSFTYTLNDGTNENNYNITTSIGTLTVTKPTTAITITAKSASKTYDGSALTAGYTFTQGVLADGDELSVTVSGSITNAGTTANEVTSYKVMRGTTDVTANYTINTVNGTLTVNKRNVTLTSATDSKTYDGTALSNSEITVSGDGFASGEGYTATVTGSQTAVGSSANTFTYTLNDGTDENNYNITTKQGTLTVTTNAPITITAESATKTYDGSALTAAGYTFTQGVLAEGDTLSVTVSGSITDAGTTTNKVTSYKVMRGTTNVTSLYTFATPVNGTLTVTKRNVTLTSGSTTKEYDGLALTCSTVTVSGSGFADNEGATWSVTGSQTNIGSSDNTFTYSLKDGTKAENYNITTATGTLTVTDMTKDTFDKAIVRSDFGYDGVLSVIPSVGNDLMTDDIDNIMANKNVSDVQFQQKLRNINKLTFNTTRAINVGFYGGEGTSKNDVITFNKGTQVTFGTAGYEIDLKAGSNTVQINDNATAIILSDLANICTLKATNYVTANLAALAFTTSLAGTLTVGNNSDFTAGDITGTQKVTTITIGKESTFGAQAITLNSSADKITVGNASTFTAASVDFGSGADTMTIGAASTAEISGNVTGINKMTLTAGTYDKKKGTTTFTALTAADIEAAANLANTFTFGNYTDVKIQNLTGSSKADQLKIGADSMFAAASIDFSSSTDTMTIGSRSTAIISGEITGLEKLTLTAGTYNKSSKKTSLTTFQAGALTGTAQNDTCSIGNYSDVDIAGDLDLGAGTDTLTLGSNSTLDADGLSGIETITLNQYSQTQAGDITGTKKLTLANGSKTAAGGLNAEDLTGLKNTVNSYSFGNFNIVDLDNITTLEKNDTLTIGTDSNFTAGDIDLGSGNNTITVGSRSTAVVDDITGLYKLTIANGAYDSKSKQSTYTSLSAGDVTGTAGNDTFNIGNYCEAEFESLNFAAGNDTLKVGNYANMNVYGDIKFVSGKNTLQIGNYTETVLKSSNAKNVTKFTIGKQSEAYLSSELVDAVTKKDKTAKVFDIGSFDVAQNFTSIAKEQGDDSFAEKQDLSSSEYDGWLCGEDNLDLTDFFQRGSAASITGASADLIFAQFDTNGNQLGDAVAFNGTFSFAANATAFSISLADEKAKATSYKVLLA